MNDLRRINRDLKLTTLVNLHHVDLALKYAHRVIGLQAGHLVFDGPTSEVDDEVLRQIYGRELLDEEVLGEVDEEVLGDADDIEI